MDGQKAIENESTLKIQGIVTVITMLVCVSQSKKRQKREAIQERFDNYGDGGMKYDQ